MKHLFYLLITFWFIPLAAQQSQTARHMENLGFVNIAEADSTIAGRVLYEDLHEAYLHPDALKGLLRAQQELKKRHPRYRLIVYDAARPMSVQQKMWNVVKGTSKYIYVSNPARGGGLHNYGLAVDISILDEAGVPLPMGTKVDHLGPEAHITNEAALVQSGKMTKQEQENRQLLRTIMRAAGFRTLSSEWWHFNWCSRQEAKQKYRVIP